MEDLEIPKSVSVVYPWKKNEVTYAHSLSQSLEIPLVVHIPFASDSAELMQDKLSETGINFTLQELQKLIKKRVCEEFEDILEHDHGIEVVFFNSLADLDPDTLGVSKRLSKELLGLATLAPAKEIDLFAREKDPDKKKILIPLGNGESGKTAFSRSVLLIKKLGISVVFWHTTWTNKKINSKNSRDHVCKEAEEVLSFAENLAKEHQIQYKTIVEQEIGVVEGILKIASKEHCCLVIMARGLTTIRGRYADQLLSKETIAVPLLIVKQEELR